MSTHQDVSAVQSDSLAANKSQQSFHDEQKVDQNTSELSKNQKKKLARLEKIAKQRQENRKKEREKRKLKGSQNICIKTNTNGETIKVHRKSLKSNLMSNSSNRIRVIIDCSFEDMMSTSDIHHLGKQLSYSYAKNRRMDSPFQFYFTSCSNVLKNLLEKSGLSNWDIHLHESHFLDVFSQENKQNICYLTSDSPNEIDDFEENKIYIIGGLVDHNHHVSKAQFGFFI
jgi:tRNA (guanine9-N1)-methyltransferase